MRWSNTEEIAEALEEAHPDIEIEKLRLNKIHRWVVQLLDFDDDPGLANERILEAIHDAWNEIRSDRY